MSKYTTEVRFICETNAGLTESQGFNDLSDILETAAPKIFNFDFPIFDENYRLPLEIKILRHYYTREICEETVALWKLRLQDKLNMIMPYYNQLYRSELLEFNPLYDVDYTRQHEGQEIGNETSSEKGTRNKTEIGNNESTKNGTKNSTKHGNDASSSKNVNSGNSVSTNMDEESGHSDENNLHWDLYSDTPQGGIDVINNDTDDVDGNTYLTNVRKVTDAKSNNFGSLKNSTGQTVNNATEEANFENDSTEITQDSTTEKETNENTVFGNEQSATDGSRNVNNMNQYIEHVIGKQGATSFSGLLNEFRQTFLNIDKMVIEELSDLFFGLW